MIAPIKSRSPSDQDLVEKQKIATIMEAIDKSGCHLQHLKLSISNTHSGRA